MSTWYKRLICKTEVSATGAVAGSLRSSVQTGLFEKQPLSTGLDTSVSTDVAQWFNTIFNPWFAELSAKLGPEAEINLLISPEYSERVNEVLIALWVARSYYVKTADEAFISSLEKVARFKAQFCEEIALAVQSAYKDTLAQYGEFEGAVFTQTIASAFDGTTPETFNWPGTVVVNHIIFENMELASENQEQFGEGKPQQKELLPWVFTGIFGVIALVAASSKPKIK